MLRMKRIIGLLIALFTVQTLSAQEVCGTDYYMEQLRLNNPEMFQESNDIIPQNRGLDSANADTLRIIPLVFHIFHDNEVGNISMEQIESAVEMLNEDFRRTNSDTNNTRAIFKPHAADSKIEFRLATIDPDGNCTNGVVRINDPNLPYNGNDDTKLESTWDVSKYFNIWVVNDIRPYPGLQGIILGYAQFPRNKNQRYGVIIRHDRVGRTGTANSGDRTLTHEIGHCLNLYHTFQTNPGETPCGSSCNSTGDYVCDTPPVNFSTQTCNKNQNQCTNDTQGPSPYTMDVNDQIENYMSYNDCQNMFTYGQKYRMDDALDDYSFLTNLVSENNLLATGVANDNPGICKAEFGVNSQQVCVGQPVQFTDYSYFNPKAHTWYFEGADVPNSTAQNPVVTYSVPGTYEVTLTVEDSTQTSTSTTKTEFITVLSSFKHTAPFTEGFEDGSSLDNLNWFGDIHSTSFGWFLDPTNGYSGNQSLRGTAYGQTGKMSVTSIAYDASNLESGKLNFVHAYAPTTSETSNYVRIYVSGNCGEDWSVLSVLGGGQLNTASTRNSAYVSPQTNDWKSNSINIPSQHLTTDLRFKFEYNANEGNNIFIDNINLSGQLNRNLQLRFPNNGATAISENPTLNWNAVDTIDYYTLEIDSDASFSSADYQSHQLSYISASSNNTDTEWDLNNLMHGQTYYWKVTGTLNGVDTTVSPTWIFTVDSTALGIDPVMSQPFKVLAYPNPSKGEVYLNVTSTSSEEVEILMYDITGNLVKTIYSGELIESETLFTISRDQMSNGIYLIQTISKNGMDTQRIVLE